MLQLANIMLRFQLLIVSSSLLLVSSGSLANEEHAIVVEERLTPFIPEVTLRGPVSLKQFQRLKKIHKSLGEWFAVEAGDTKCAGGEGEGNSNAFSSKDSGNYCTDERDTCNLVSRTVTVRCFSYSRQEQSPHTRQSSKIVMFSASLIK